MKNKFLSAVYFSTNTVLNPGDPSLVVFTIFNVLHTSFFGEKLLLKKQIHYFINPTLDYQAIKQQLDMIIS
jgi:hypothetical protein